jgi:hypothetical protein
MDGVRHEVKALPLDVACERSESHLELHPRLTALANLKQTTGVCVCVCVCVCVEGEGGVRVQMTQQ